MTPRAVLQAGTIPIRDGQLCLITSRSGRRWVIPKGRIERNHTPAEAALAEAWEEAGLVGVLMGESIGTYEYEKIGLLHRVTVFVLSVSEEHSNWPERRLRTREWVTVSDALGRVTEPGLRELIQGVTQSG